MAKLQVRNINAFKARIESITQTSFPLGITLAESINGRVQLRSNESDRSLGYIASDVAIFINDLDSTDTEQR